MYTRTYPPRGTPLPENYSGVALREELHTDASALQSDEGRVPSLEEERTITEETRVPVCSENEKTEGEALSDSSPVFAEMTHKAEEEEEAGKAEKKHDDAPSASAKKREDERSVGESDLLLIALAALLAEGERRDDELLVILLLLLLS